MRIYGIGATESVDRTGEVVKLDGMDISEVSLWNDEHNSRSFFQILGHVQESKKIYKPEECTDEYQRKCWDTVKKPFLYVAGEIMDDHPNAAAAAALVRYGTVHPEYPVGLSVEGMTLDRSGSVLTKTKVKNVSLTVKPANPDCRVFAQVDLTKSFSGPVSLPEQYKGAENRKSFRNIPSEEQRILSKSVLLAQTKELLKTEGMDTSGVTLLKCWNCGEGKIFVKSRLPNRCVACSEAFTMSDIFKARSTTHKF
jgi:hypothetical protein